MYTIKKTRHILYLAALLMLVTCIFSYSEARAATGNSDAFLDAAKNGDIAQMKALLEKDPALIKAQYPQGNTALHVTAYYGKGTGAGKTKGGYREIIGLLIEKGIPVSSQNGNGQTALHFAALAGNLELAEILLQKGADVRALNKKRETPLHLASQGHNTALAEFFIAEGADVNAENVNGSTPLHQAAFVTDPDMMSLLIGKGAHINARKKDGNTPLHMAAIAGDADSVMFLLSKGADRTVRNAKGQTALDMTSDDEVIKVLTSKEAK